MQSRSSVSHLSRVVKTGAQIPDEEDGVAGRSALPRNWDDSGLVEFALAKKVETLEPGGEAPPVFEHPPVNSCLECTLHLWGCKQDDGSYVTSTNHCGAASTHAQLHGACISSTSYRALPRACFRVSARSWRLMCARACMWDAGKHLIACTMTGNGACSYIYRESGKTIGLPTSFPSYSRTSKDFETMA